MADMSFWLALGLLAGVVACGLVAAVVLTDLSVNAELRAKRRHVRTGLPTLLECSRCARYLLQDRLGCGRFYCDWCRAHRTPEAA